MRFAVGDHVVLRRLVEPVDREPAERVGRRLDDVALIVAPRADDDAGLRLAVHDHHVVHSAVALTAFRGLVAPKEDDLALRFAPKEETRDASTELVGAMLRSAESNARIRKLRIARSRSTMCAARA